MQLSTKHDTKHSSVRKEGFKLAQIKAETSFESSPRGDNTGN